MELSNITAWLAGPQPFAQGVALYAQLGSNATYQRLFALGETSYSRQVLVRELSAFVRDAVTPSRPPEPPAATLPVVPAPPPEPLPNGEGSEVLQDVRRQLKVARDERSHLHPQLTAPNLGKKARFALAARILDLTDAIIVLLAQEAHVVAHGRLPGPVPTEQVSDTGVLRQRLTNLVSRRAKLKKRPDRAADLATAETEITLIRSKIKALSNV